MWRRKRCENLSGRPLVPVQSFAGRGEITGGKVGHRPIRFSRTRFSSQVAKETLFMAERCIRSARELSTAIGTSAKWGVHQQLGSKRDIQRQTTQGHEKSQRNPFQPTLRGH